jgi:hypothetical protein
VTTWKLPSGETIELDLDRTELESAIEAAARLPALEAEAAGREGEILAAFESTEADGIDDESAAVHLAAVAALREAGIDRDSASEEQYVEAVERTAKTNPLPKAGDPRSMPRRKVSVDPEGRPTRGGELWSDADEYARHNRALEIDPGALADAYRYARALEEARKEEEANR